MLGRSLPTKRSHCPVLSVLSLHWIHLENKKGILEDINAISIFFLSILLLCCCYGNKMENSEENRREDVKEMEARDHGGC